MLLMSTTNAVSDRSAELQAAIRFVFDSLQKASVGYDRLQPADARARAGIALAAAIHLISGIYPNEPVFVSPLNGLLYSLFDLDHGKVVPLLHPAKIANSPGNALADELFKAIAAAAMTLLVEGKVMQRKQASQDILKRLRAMGITHLSGKAITANQIAKWREKMMRELAWENLAVARYELALKYVGGLEPVPAVKFLLDSLPASSTIPAIPPT
jgi:hypothetical protein